MTRSIIQVTTSVCVLAMWLCLGCSDSTTEPASGMPDAESKPVEKPTLEEASPQLTGPEQEVTSAQPRGQVENLINDPSLEDAELGALPHDWSTYPVTKPNFQYEVVAGGHTGNQCLRIESPQAGACVFTNGVSPIDRTKRYALKGWAKFEGDGNAKAIIKFNYFHNRKWLGANDLIGVSSNQEGWQLLEKTDAADDFPKASQIWVSCNIKGSGEAWFDDLELVAYDHKDLLADFDSRHGKDNLASKLLVLDRWAGQWESTITDKLTDAAVGISNLAKIQDDRILQSHWTSEDGSEEMLSLLTYDDGSAAYRLWTFSSKGEALEFVGQWDDATSTLTLQVVSPAPGVTGTRITRFVDVDTIETRLVLKDEAGVVTRDMLETLTRKSKTAASDIPSADDTSALPPGLKPLPLGDFRQTGTFFKAAWTPNQRPLTATASTKCILDGRFTFDEVKLDEREGTQYVHILRTYDAQRKSYRRWEFNSNGGPSESTGKWDADAKSMTWSHTSDDGLTSTVTDRHVNPDTVEWSLVIKDPNGKVYLHAEGKAARVE